MSCRDVIAILADFVDGVMPAALGVELQRHLQGCEPCRAYLATYRKARALGTVVGRIEMPAEMQARLRRFLGDTLRTV